MSNQSNYAAYNIRNGKGFECPTCNSFVVAGYDYCPNCGETPETLDSQSQYIRGGFRSSQSYDFSKLQVASSGYLFWLIALLLTSFNKFIIKYIIEFTPVVFWVALFFTLVALRHFVILLGDKFGFVKSRITADDIKKQNKGKTDRLKNKYEYRRSIVFKNSVPFFFLKLCVFYMSSSTLLTIRTMYLTIKATRGY